MKSPTMILLPAVWRPDISFNNNSVEITRRQEWVNSTAISRVYADANGTTYAVVDKQHIETELSLPELLARLGCSVPDVLVPPRTGVAWRGETFPFDKFDFALDTWNGMRVYIGDRPREGRPVMQTTRTQSAAAANKALQRFQRKADEMTKDQPWTIGIAQDEDGLVDPLQPLLYHGEPIGALDAAATAWIVEALNTVERGDYIRSVGVLRGGVRYDLAINVPAKPFRSETQ